MREVAWVIFDEIHYMRDAGVCRNDEGETCREFWNSLGRIYNSYIDCNKLHHNLTNSRARRCMGGDHHSSS